MKTEPPMFRTFGHETVEVVHAEGTADEKRFCVEAHVQPDSGFVSVDAPIYEGDIVEIKDPHRVIGSAGKLFADGHFSKAVTEAFVSIEVRVRGLLGSENSGTKLMDEAFGGKDPKPSNT